MLCPRCEKTLHMTERQGIEIDYCPSCRGVWLDRGELDKIIERSTELTGGGGYQQPQRQPEPRPDEGRYQQRTDPRYKYGDSRGYRHKKKKNMLSEIFDIFD